MFRLTVATILTPVTTPSPMSSSCGVRWRRMGSASTFLAKFLVDPSRRLAMRKMCEVCSRGFFLLSRVVFCQCEEQAL